MSSTATSLAAADFGHLLRDWRNHRRMSQLGLSSQSGISQRHISFLETGRSNPSRPMVLALADSLDIPLRERNTLLQSAGFSPSYAEHSLDEQAAGVFRTALQAILDQAEPFPALVVNGRWNLVMANNGALRFFAEFIDLDQVFTDAATDDFQLIRLCLRDNGLAPFITNWQDLIYAFLQRARRALLINPRDPHLPVLIEEIITHPQAPGEWQRPDWSTPAAPALTMDMSHAGRDYSLFTMLAHFGAAQSITLEELSVELFYPADEATRGHLMALADGGSSGSLSHPASD